MRFTLQNYSGNPASTAEVNHWLEQNIRDIKQRVEDSWGLSLGTLEEYALSGNRLFFRVDMPEEVQHNLQELRAKTGGGRDIYVTIHKARNSKIAFYYRCYFNWF